MIKFVAGVALGTFAGAVVLEILKRFRPGLIESIEKKAKLATDRLFENLQEDLGLHEADS